jgi:AcrR family transcriptional regulator
MRTADPQKEEQTRAEIITAAQKILQTYGLEKTTMDDIANAVGKGKSTLYYYYKSKEDVFYAVAQKEMADIEQLLQIELAKCKTSSERLKAMMITRHNGVKSKMVIYSVLINETRRFIELFGRIQREGYKMELESLKAILLDGIRSGEFKRIKEDECESLAQLGMLLWRGMAANILVSGQLPPESMKVDTAADIFIRGLK